MRILIAVHHFPPAFTAGAEWQAFRTAKGLQARGHDVSVVTVERVDDGPSNGVAWVDDVYMGLPVRRLNFNRALCPDERLWEYRNDWIRDHCVDWWRQERPDLVHVVSGYLLTGGLFEATEALALPTVLTLTDFWWLCPRNTLLRSDGSISTAPEEPWRCARCVAEEQPLVRRLGRLSQRLADAYWQRQPGPIGRIEARRQYLRERFGRVNSIISPSRFLRDAHVAAGVAPDRITVSRQGIELIDKGLHLNARKISSDRLRVAYMGQIAELKGVHVLVDAVRQIDDPRLQLRIYGDMGRFPAYSARLKQQAAGDTRISFPGPFVGAEGLATVLSEVDVLVVPSLWYENSPNVILEAFALKTPVVVSDFGGMAELVEPEVDGLRFGVGDSADLARQLRRLSNEAGLLERLTAGTPTIRSVSDEMQALEAEYTSVLAR